MTHNRPKRWYLLTSFFFIVLPAIAWSIHLNASDGSGTEPVERVSVEAEAVQSMPFEQTIKVSGMVAAEMTAGVSARIPGVLDEICVNEGDRVEAGQTVLFRTDALKVNKALEIAEKQLAVAECAVREREAYRDQVKADYDKAELDVERYRRLYHDDHAVSTNTYELQESRFKQAEAALKHADVLVELNREQLEQARSNVSIARKDCSDSRVTSPVSGLVFRRNKESGEMAEMGKPVIEIYNDDSMEISAFLPQELYQQIVPGQTCARVRIGPIDLGQRLITYKSPSIDSRLRTFEIKTRVDDPPDGVVPGALAEMTVILQTRTGPGVPAGSVLDRATGQVIFVVENNVAKMIPVRTGYETGSHIEIVDGPIPAGAMVVTLGQNLLNDGDAVEVKDSL